MKKRVLLLLAVAWVSIFGLGSLFWYFEHGNNPGVNDFLDVVWWWFVSSATVGYGDIVPHTWQGRVVAIVVICIGFYIFASFVAIIAESAHNFLERRTLGTAKVEAKKHIVLCEYTAIADELIQSLPECDRLKDLEVVIVTDLVPRNPYPKHYFVSGVPINPASLQRANISEASYVFIFANLRFADPDIKTMHIASRVLALNGSAKIYVELIDPKSDLLKLAPARVMPLDSRKLIEAVMRDGRIKPVVWETLCEQDRRA